MFNNKLVKWQDSSRNCNCNRRFWADYAAHLPAMGLPRNCPAINTP